LLLRLPLFWISRSLEPLLIARIAIQRRSSDARLLFPGGLELTSRAEWQIVYAEK